MQVLPFYLQYLVRLRQAAVAGPLDVEGARLIGALKGVCTKEIALALDQGGGQARGAQAVVVGQRRGKDRGGQAHLGCRDDDAAPRFDEVFQLALEVGIKDQGGQLWVVIKCLADAVKNLARMMQPPRQMVARSRGSTSQPNSAEPALISSKPWE